MYDDPSRPRAEFMNRRDTMIILSVTIIGGLVRASYLNARSFINDDIGTLIRIESSYSYLATHFEPWTTMNYFLIVEKYLASILTPAPFILAAIPLLAGILAIPVSALTARSFLPPGPSISVSILVALNPYLVYQSTRLRSYSLLVTLTLLLVLCAYRWLSLPSYRNGAWFALTAFTLVLMHPDGVYPLAALAVYVASQYLPIVIRRSTRPSIREIATRGATIALPMTASCAGLVIAYARIFPHMKSSASRFFGTAPTSADYLSEVWSTYFGTGYLGWPTAALFVVGIWASLERRSNTRGLMPLIFLPPVFLSMQGISHFPWAYARFFVFIVPFILVMAYRGAWELIGRTESRWPNIAVAGLLTLLWAPGLFAMFGEERQYPWNSVRDFVVSLAVQDDLVLSLEPNVNHNMDPRPLGELYTRVPLKALRVEHVQAAMLGLGPRRAFLVIKDAAVHGEAEKHEFGKLTVLVYPIHGYDDLSDSIHRDLVGLVADRFPTDPEYAPIYDGIIAVGRNNPQLCPDLMYHELYSAARARTDKQLFASPNMLRLDAESVSRTWRRRHSALSHGE